MKVTGTFEEEQAEIIADALDLYSRVLEGQFDTIYSLIRMHVGPYAAPEFKPHGIAIKPDFESLKRLLEAARDAAMPQLERGAYIGIAQAPKVAMIAYDIRAKLLHDIAWHRSPSGGNTVDFYEPVHLVKTLPLPEVKIE
jgi:hypothetical protein